MDKLVTDPNCGRQIRVTIRLNEELHTKLFAYSELTGVPVNHVVNELLTDGVEATLVARLEALQTKRNSNVISIDTLALAAAAN